jgi:hypothetical protein
MTLSNREDSELVKAIREMIDRARLHRSCLTCRDFNEETEGCELAGGQRPPARVIATGCPKYFEEPPF